MTSPSPRMNSLPLKDLIDDSVANNAKQNVNWLNAWHDPVANIKAYSPLLELADLLGDGDFKLLIADLDRKLKVYKGTSLVSEHNLLEVPVALVSYYFEQSTPAIPAVAVASGPYIFIYHNLKPYYKFTLPLPHVDPIEIEVWNDLRNDKIDGNRAKEIFKSANDNGKSLSQKSMDLLAIQDQTKVQEFVKTNKNQPIVQPASITCMTSLKKTREDPTAVSSLVVGTESGQVIILEPNASSILKKITVNSPPSFLAASGLFDVEYRIVIACRNGRIYTMKNGDLTGVTFELEVPAVGLVRIDKHVYVGCTDNVIHAYQIRGKRAYSLYMPAPILNMELLHSTTNSKALLVALANGELRMYYEKNLISIMHLDPTSSTPSTYMLGGQNTATVSAMKFGHFGRETGALILVFKGGALQCKILSRTSSNLSQLPPLSGHPVEQDIPLKVPKKTKLYVEQTLRERDNPIEMHRVFQRELYKLRLATARSYYKVISDTQGPLSYTAGTNIRLTAQVQGIGPLFKLKLLIENTGKRSLQDMTITFMHNHELYNLSSPVIQIPVLVPELSYKVEANVECLNAENGGSEPIRVFVCPPNSSLPLVTAIISIPVPEIPFQT